MNSKSHYYSLDFLKFVLSLIILFCHFQYTTLVDFKYVDFINGTVNFGTVVEFFFIISGFLSAMKTEKTKQLSFEEFMQKRIIRLYPMTALTNLVMVILFYIDYFFFSAFRDGLIPDVFKVLCSFLLIFTGGAIDVGRGINNPLWYVCVLLLCYIVMFIVLKISDKYGINELYLFIFVCLIGIGIHDYNINLPFANRYSCRGYSAFFFGMILYHIYQKYSHPFIYKMSYLIFLCCLFLGLVYYSAFFDHDWGALVFVFYPSILFIMLSLENVFNNRFFGYLGGISFEVYIWHSLFNRFLQMFGGFFSRFYGTPFLFMMVYSVVVVAFSAVMYFFVEKPFTAFCRKMYAKIVA